MEENIYNLGGFSFEEVSARVTSGEHPIFFDRVYALMPNLQATGIFAKTAADLVLPDGQIHFLSEALFAIDRAREVLEESGFETVRLSVPPDVVPQVGMIRFRGKNDRLYWLAARRRPAHSFPFPPFHPGEPASGSARVQIGERTLGHIISPDILWEILPLLHQAVPFEDLARGFLVSHGGLKVDDLRLSFSKSPKKELIILGNIVDAAGECAGTFTRAIPKPPKPGERWVAEGRGMSMYPAKRIGDTDYRRRGFGRVLLIHFLRFLKDLGVDAFRMSVERDGNYVWPHLGFDFIDSATRDRFKEELSKWLWHRALLTPPRREAVERIAHAWEMADFQDETMGPLGRRFLLGREQEEAAEWQAVFDLRSDYPGWSRLYKEPTK